jgi:lipid-binding SYLF domain-containing protein
MKSPLAMLAIALCLASPTLAAQIFSWDPLKDVEQALPEGVPNENRIIQARLQVREMAQDALATLHEMAPGTRSVIDRAAGYGVFSTFGVKLFFAGGTTGKGMVVNQRTHRQTFMKMVQVQGGLGFGVNQNRLIFVFTTEKRCASSSIRAGSSAGKSTCRRWPVGRAACSAAPPRCRPAFICTS